MSYRYKPAVLEQLSAHGVRPTERTPPDLVRDFVSDLYRYELRALRARLLRGEIARTEYYGRVIAVRVRYPVLSLKPWQWVEGR